MADPTLDQVRVFLAVVDTGSFSAAARTLDRAQSAVSYAIANLEKTIEVQLFERRGARALLTVAGEKLLPAARALLDRAEALQEEARRVQGGAESRLHLALDGLLPRKAASRALRVVRDRFPGVPVLVRWEVLGAVPALLLEGACDLGVSPHLSDRAPQITSSFLTRVEMVCVGVPALAGPEGHIKVEALETVPQIVVTDRTDFTKNATFSVVGSAQWRVSDLDTKVSLVRAGVGWGLLPRYIAQEDLQSGRLVALSVPALPFEAAFEISVGWLPSRTPGPMAQAFLDALRLELARILGPGPAR
jgi:DNA-binding transcriptional LysR family regulator